uniref:Uncharacterized protein n=1 Tax=Cacopsylla melanoneura TaxID=428564 RepID=A0A8D8XI44_9HEMI
MSSVNTRMDTRTKTLQNTRSRLPTASLKDSTHMWTLMDMCRVFIMFLTITMDSEWLPQICPGPLYQFLSLWFLFTRNEHSGCETVRFNKERFFFPNITSRVASTYMLHFGEHSSKDSGHYFTKD